MTNLPAGRRSAAAAVRPVPVARRDVTPDLARGFALLGIAVVNAQLLAPRAVAGTADKVSAVVVTLFLENRTWPMFALLFGFGIAAIAARLDTAGLTPRQRNRVLRRRHLWLAVFGLAQVVLVFWADILAVYGLTAFVVVALLDRSPRVRAVFGIVSVTLWTLATFVGNLEPTEVPRTTDYLTALGERLGVFAFWTGSNSLLLTHLAPMLVGVALYRIGALHRPGAHRPLLRRLAGVGAVVGLTGAVPLALVVAGAWQPDEVVVAAMRALHAATGLGLGLAYVALIGLWSAGRAAGGPLLGPLALVAEVGRRPLTSYLVHSVLLGLALSAWALDLGPHLSTATTYGLGVAVWACCAAVAAGLAAAHRPGPADALLRQFAYRRTVGARP